MVAGRMRGGAPQVGGGTAMNDVIHLSTDALVKAINDEYAVIFESERNTLPRASAIGEKLVALKDRVEHGEWKPYLEKRRLLATKLPPCTCGSTKNRRRGGNSPPPHNKSPPSFISQQDTHTP